MALNEILQRIDSYSQVDKDFNKFGMGAILKDIASEIGIGGTSRIDDLENKFDNTSGRLKSDYLSLEIKDYIDFLTADGNIPTHLQITRDGLTFLDDEALLQLGEITNWVGNNNNQLENVYSITLGNAGQNISLLELVPKTFHQDDDLISGNPVNHYINSTELQFNHRIIIPNLYNGATDVFGSVGTSLWFQANASNGYSASLGFVNNDMTSGVGLYWVDNLNALLMDTVFGGDFGFVLNSTTGTKLRFLKEDYSTEIGSIDGNGNIDVVSYSAGGIAGWTGTFTNGDGKTVTVTKGLITNVV